MMQMASYLLLVKAEVKASKASVGSLVMVGFQHDVISIDCPNMVFMWTERNRATSGRYVGA